MTTTGPLLDAAARRQVLDHGYVVLRNVVPRPLVEAALRSINASLGENGIDPARLTEYRSRSYCPELETAAQIVAPLLESPAWDAAGELVGAGRLRTPTSAQIALRFPLPPGVAPHTPRPHIDGYPTRDNGVPEGRILHFTMLAGVLLSDVPQPQAGNFTVWEGSHRVFAEQLRRHGPDAIGDGLPELPLADPVQVTGQAGDVILAHYGLGHAVAANSSPHTRYALFFRLHHVDHDADGPTPLLDLWREWEGLRAG